MGKSGKSGSHGKGLGGKGGKSFFGGSAKSGKGLSHGYGGDSRPFDGGYYYDGYGYSKSAKGYAKSGKKHGQSDYWPDYDGGWNRKMLGQTRQGCTSRWNCLVSVKRKQW